MSVSGPSFRIIDGSLTSGGGDVTGPGSSINAGIAIWNGTGGTDLADSGVLISSLVAAPGSSTDNAIARYDGTSGNIQDSAILIDDSNNVTGMGTLSAGAITSSATFIAANGTEALPAYTWTGNTSNGMWYAGSSVVRISSNGSAGLGLDQPNNNVALGFNSTSSVRTTGYYYARRADHGEGAAIQAATILVLENSTAPQVQFLGPDSQFKGFFFNEGSDPDGAQFRYTYDGTEAGSKYEWRSNAAEIMDLQGDGRLVVGKVGSTPSNTMYARSLSITSALEGSASSVVLETTTTTISQSDSVLALITNANDSDAYLRMRTTQGTDARVFVGASENKNGYLRYSTTTDDMDAAEIAAYWRDNDFAASMSHVKGVNGGRLELSSGDVVVRTFRGSTPTSDVPIFFEVPAISGVGNGVRVVKPDATNLQLDLSTMTGVFGTTASTAWGTDDETGIPFFVYIVNQDNTASGLRLAMSRKPDYKKIPSANAYAYESNAATTDDDNAIYFSSASDESATANGKPMLLIGGVILNKDASDVWSVSAEGLNFDEGAGLRADPFAGKIFTFPTGQNGAASGSHLSSAGTVPSWATAASIRYHYTVSLDGHIDIAYSTVLAGNCTNGSGGNQLQLRLPAESSDTHYASSGANYVPIGTFSANGASNPDGILSGAVDGGSQRLNLYDDAISSILDSEFSDVADDVRVNFRYKAFDF
jgi:hypothetical protein